VGWHCAAIGCAATVLCLRYRVRLVLLMQGSFALTAGVCGWCNRGAVDCGTAVHGCAVLEKGRVISGHAMGHLVLHALQEEAWLGPVLGVYHLLQ
jgi:hypothetical protein